ncbi:hypothetical protein [Flavobacterium aquidurense]|uniref:hypothetical protein n=1 Tax=Flavobacterium aquidurense TaxID=362413 RepID=UPI0028594F7F|nr:hypothetical protein [Flavobacterium aquidurense]MDR7370161.1 hypothetical protein [Flavobacterium aquidurense]
MENQNNSYYGHENHNSHDENIDTIVDNETNPSIENLSGDDNQQIENQYIEDDVTDQYKPDLSNDVNHEVNDYNRNENIPNEEQVINEDDKITNDEDNEDPDNLDDSLDKDGDLDDNDEETDAGYDHVEENDEHFPETHTRE